MGDHVTSVTSPLNPAEVYSEYSSYVKKLIRKSSTRYTGMFTEEDFEDIEQEIWIRIIKHLDEFRGECKLSTYIGKIIINYIADYSKSVKKHASDVDIDLLTDIPHDSRSKNPEEIIEIESMIEIILSLVLTMNEKRQMIFYLIGLENLTQSETAKRLKLTQSTISEHWTSIQQELKHELDKHFPNSKYDLKGLLWRIDTE